MTRGNYDRHVRAQRAARRTADGEADDSAPATSRRSRAAWTAASLSQTLRAGKPIAKKIRRSSPHICCCTALCRLRVQCCGRSPQVQRARVCKRVLAAGRALVPRWLGRRPTASGYSLLDVIDDQDVHRPDRTRASPGLELRADGMAVAPM